MSTIENLLVDQYYSFAEAAATLIDLNFDSGAQKELRRLIRKGVKKLINTQGNANIGEVAGAAKTLLNLVLSLDSGEQQIISESIVIKSWKKRCPGCPPWC